MGGWGKLWAGVGGSAICQRSKQWNAASELLPPAPSLLTDLTPDCWLPLLPCSPARATTGPRVTTPRWVGWGGACLPACLQAAAHAPSPHMLPAHLPHRATLPHKHTDQGAELIDSVLDVVRKEAEGCDCLQGRLWSGGGASLRKQPGLRLPAGGAP